MFSRAVDAGADEPIERLPHGYDTTLARAFLREADLVGPDQGVSWMRSPRLRRVTTRSMRSSLVSAPGTRMATWE